MDSSVLFRLSPEIRNQIWEYLFDTSKYAVTLTPGRLQHPLTKTCRQLRHETLSMYYSLTRFNAHLGDDPATPVAEWLKVIGPEKTLLVDEVNIWDMHMLNSTIHGLAATQRLLKHGPPRQIEDPPDLSALGSHIVERKRTHSANQSYVIRPMGERGFVFDLHLKDIIMALHSMHLGLERFWISEKDADDRRAPQLKMTSKFAIVRL